MCCKTDQETTQLTCSYNGSISHYIVPGILTLYTYKYEYSHGALTGGVTVVTSVLLIVVASVTVVMLVVVVEAEGCLSGMGAK